jgi:Rha family phage regulatory protein
MFDLVKITEDREVVTDSLKVAEYFGKRHDDVLKRIRMIKEKGVIRERNFALSQYESKTPTKGIVKLPCYKMDKDGFVLLALGFTGNKAHQFKLEYIKAFNKAIETIQTQQKQLASQSEELHKKNNLLTSSNIHYKSESIILKNALNDANQNFVPNKKSEGKLSEANGKPRIFKRKGYYSSIGSKKVTFHSDQPYLPALEAICKSTIGDLEINILSPAISKSKSLQASI